MNPLPPLIAIDTPHVWAAVMGGERACLQLLAAKLHEAVVAAGGMATAPMRAAPTPTGGGTADVPPRLPGTTSFAASPEAAKIVAPAAAPAPDGPTVTIKGAEIPLSRVLDLWYEADSLAAIGAVFGCSHQTVVNVSKRLDLPARFSPAWVAERDLRRRASGRALEPVAAAPADPADPPAADRDAAPPAPVASDPPWPEKPKPRVRCQFVLSADRNGATTCRGDRVAGEVYCADHLAQVRTERGRP